LAQFNLENTHHGKLGNAANVFAFDFHILQVSFCSDQLRVRFGLIHTGQRSVFITHWPETTEEICPSIALTYSGYDLGLATGEPAAKPRDSRATPKRPFQSHTHGFTFLEIKHGLRECVSAFKFSRIDGGSIQETLHCRCVIGRYKSVLLTFI
jgi:hypothetical protein